MSRLVIVSNRVALPNQPRAGGLAIALRSALKEEGGLWFGWSGKRVRGASGDLHHDSVDGIDYCTMDLSYADHDAYYTGFSNRTLWPALHFRLDLVDYTRETREGYHRVNGLFADRLAAQLRDTDTVWVHDYHLIPLGQQLRERGVGCRIGFFLHVPMPSSDLVGALPGHGALFGALSAYDLVGFQTVRDVERFQDYVRLFGGGRVLTPSRLEDANGRRFRATAFPISIDTARVTRDAALAAGKASVLRLRASLAERALAIGVDRLDYSKGLPDRFRAFERYLARHADHSKRADRLTLLQIAPASRTEVPEYRDLRRELEGLSGHINGVHSEPDWTPVRYVNKNFLHEVLFGFYRLANMALVTPLRDGMNLVAKEFVAAQDPEDPGVLILSRFAGAASELTDALLVNPFDLDGVADAIARAHVMPVAERRERWRASMKIIERHDITHWRRSFIEALQAT